VKPVNIASTPPDQIFGVDGLEKGIWIQRAISYALSLLHEAKQVPKFNPMEEATSDIPLCCHMSVHSSGDLAGCSLPCTRAGVFNILKLFPGV